MFPIRDTIPHQHVPVMTLLVIAANVAAFAYELTLPEEALEELVSLNGIVPRRYVDGDWALGRHFRGPDLWPFLSSMFLHGGWLHLLSNMSRLWIFGDNVEDRLGSLRYLAFYCVRARRRPAAPAANPLSDVPTIGASGAIAGVMGAYFLMYPRARVVTLVPVRFPLFCKCRRCSSSGCGSPWCSWALPRRARSGAASRGGRTSAASSPGLLLLFSGARARRRRVEYVLLCSLAVGSANGDSARAPLEQTRVAELLG